MSDKELYQLGKAESLSGSALMYTVLEDGNSRYVELDDLKEFINDDPIVPPKNSWRGERVSRNVNFTTPTSNFFYSVIWQVSASENSEFWSLASPNWLVVPAGVTKIRLSASVVFSPNSTGQRFVGMIKNGSLAAGMPSSQSSGSSALVSSCSIVSAVLSVVEGDYFELRVAQGSGGSLPILPDPRTWFQIEVVEEDLI